MITAIIWILYGWGFIYSGALMLFDEDGLVPWRAMALLFVVMAVLASAATIVVNR